MKIKPTYQELEKEIRRLNQQLESKEDDRKFNSFFENNRAVMLELDSESKRVINANKAAINFYGYSKEELLLKTINDFNTLSPDEISKLMKKAVRKKSNFFQFKHRIANGEIKNVEVYSSFFKVDNNIHVFITIYDITDRVKIEQEFHASEERFRHAFEYSGLGFCLVGTDGVFYVLIVLLVNYWDIVKTNF